MHRRLRAHAGGRFQSQLGSIGAAPNGNYEYYFTDFSIPAWFDWRHPMAMGADGPSVCFQSQLGSIGALGQPQVGRVMRHVFNPSLVRLARELKTIFELVDGVFNPSLVRLALLHLLQHLPPDVLFNPSLVRLAQNAQALSDLPYCLFNPSLVRLAQVSPVHSACIEAIFNPSLVRLAPRSAAARRNWEEHFSIPAWFDWRTPPKSWSQPPKPFFNPSLVRLAPCPPTCRCRTRKGGGNIC